MPPGSAERVSGIVPTIRDPAPIPVPPDLEALGVAMPGLLDALRDARVVGEVAGSLDERQIELTRLGALVALGAPESSYRAHVSRALLAGASSQDVWSAVASVATLVGVPRLLEATPLVARALAAAEE